MVGAEKRLCMVCMVCRALRDILRSVRGQDEQCWVYTQKFVIPTYLALAVAIDASRVDGSGSFDSVSPSTVAGCGCWGGLWSHWNG